MEIKWYVKSSCCDDKEGGLIGGDMCTHLWSNLPEDLIFELLRRLPAVSEEEKDRRALLELRCVSKSFNDAISRLCLPKLAACGRVGGFVFQWERSVYPERYYYSSLHKMHKRRPEPPPRDHYGYVTETGARYALRGGELVKSYLSLLPFKPNRDDFLGCFNGFFLVRNTSLLPIQYYLCNPATKQSLPIPLNPQHLYKDSFAGFAFDPLHSPHNFKIVRFDCIPRELDLFSSTTGKWVNHRIPLQPDILQFHWNMRSLYANGVFYMLAMRKYLLCFDLNPTTSGGGALKARAVELPPRSGEASTGLFEKSNGCLYYACQVGADLLVWTFKVGHDEGSPWTLRYDIKTSETDHLGLGRTFRNQYFIFAVDLSAEIMYGGSLSMACTYDLRSTELKLFGFVPDGIILYSANLCFYPYSCCLVMLSDQFLSDQTSLGPTLALSCK